ncbi:MAG: tetratricopeptide repeat protein [Methanoregulaceae archaeon]
MISVLFVDDEPALLEITRLFLERSGEMKVDTCRSALEAMERLKSNTYDVIVSDYEMPMMDGIVFLKILRAEGDNTPFIIFTGKGREHVAKEALNNRADFYLQKGSDPKSQFAELDGMIRQGLQRKIAEESLHSADRRMVDIINHLPDATFAIDSEGTVVSWNRAMEEFTGIRAGQMIGKGDYEYAIPFYGKRRPVLVDLLNYSAEEIERCAYANVKKEEPSVVAETRNAMRKGEPATMWVRATRICDEKGRVIGAIESVRDITDIRKIEDDRKKKEEKDREFGLFDRMFGKSADAWYRKGVDLYYKQGKFSDAIVCFDRVIEMDPRHMKAWKERGICLKELGRYEEAIQCFDRSIALTPKERLTYYFRGEALEKLGKSSGDSALLEEALRCFDIVLQDDPENVNAWNYRGVCLKELHRHEEARKSFDQAQMLLRIGKTRR